MIIYKKDPFVMWVISGVIGVSIRNIYSFFAKQIGLAQFYIWNLGASLMVEKPQIQTIWGNVLGLIIDGVIGGMFGVVIGLLLEWRGNSNYIIKGWGIGMMSWMFFYGILYHNLPFTVETAPKDALSNISAFIGHSIYGISAALVYVKFFYKRFEDELV